MYTKQQLEAQSDSELNALIEEYGLDICDFDGRNEAIVAILEVQTEEMNLMEKLGVIAKAKAEASLKRQSIAIVKNHQGYWSLPTMQWMISKPEDVPDSYTYVTVVHPDPA